MNTLEYVKSRLEYPLNESDELVLNKLVLLSFSDLKMLLKLHSDLFNKTDLKEHKGWDDVTSNFETLIGLAFDYKYYEIFGTTFSDICHAYNHDLKWIEIQKKEGLCFIDGEFSHLEQGALYGVFD